MSSLPVAAILPELLQALSAAPQVLLNAPTGAGKSTWLPLQILRHGGVSGKIILLEPRRLAARNVAQRLAELLGEKPGETVGYRMRADTCVSDATRLEVVTEGILTRMLQQDPELSGVGLVILDEFHERSLQADLALALLLDVQQGLRDDLRLLIMSATLDNDRLRALLPDAPVIVSEGRAFPVERRYLSLSAHQRFDEAVAAAAAGLLVNARHVPFGVSVRDLVGRRGAALLGCHIMNDESVVFGLSQKTPEQRRAAYWLCGLGVAIIWPVGALLGAGIGKLLPAPETIGLDAVFPAILLALTLPAFKNRATLARALSGAAISLAAVPFVATGLPVLLSLFGLLARKK